MLCFVMSHWDDVMLCYVTFVMMSVPDMSDSASQFALCPFSPIALRSFLYLGRSLFVHSLFWLIALRSFCSFALAFHRVTGRAFLSDDVSWSARPRSPLAGLSLASRSPLARLSLASRFLLAGLALVSFGLSLASPLPAWALLWLGLLFFGLWFCWACESLAGCSRLRQAVPGLSLLFALVFPLHSLSGPSAFIHWQSLRFFSLRSASSASSLTRVIVSASF
jgi:hypothetical protein